MIIGEIRDILILYVIRDYKNNLYLCRVIEEDMEFEWSDLIYINFLCKYEIIFYEEIREWKKLFVMRNIKYNKYLCIVINKFDGIY